VVVGGVELQPGEYDFRSSPPPTAPRPRSVRRRGGGARHRGDPELEAEGGPATSSARSSRPDATPACGERPDLAHVAADAETVAAFETHRDLVMGETLAVEVATEVADVGEPESWCHPEDEVGDRARVRRSRSPGGDHRHGRDARSPTKTSQRRRPKSAKKARKSAKKAPRRRRPAKKAPAKKAPAKKAPGQEGGPRRSREGQRRRRPAKKAAAKKTPATKTPRRRRRRPPRRRRPRRR
jgi:hypothetical protein